ncbi:hypothetical protein [Granulicella sp. dw_53]|uniref:hypothetical protein n=1 Tax=Granulicella sp. dw_53 TaxID=2719792 RepID=UPI001BD5EA3A|nr:hypothetical protein [Granulicella sp. dw_53]
MGIFDKLFGKGEPSDSLRVQPKQAVLVHLNGSDLDQSIYDENDLSTIEDLLIAKLDGTGLGEFDGNEVGNYEAILYLYGDDAEKLFDRVEPVLRGYPLCQKAKVIIRQGEPGAVQREVTL